MTAREHLSSNGIGFTRLPDGRVRVRVITERDLLTFRAAHFTPVEWDRLVEAMQQPGQA